MLLKKVNKSAVNKLLRQMMGYGYVMVHGKGSNNVEIYDVDEEYFTSKATTITGAIELAVAMEELLVLERK